MQCHFFAIWQLEVLDSVFQLTCSISLLLDVQSLKLSVL